MNTHTEARTKDEQVADDRIICRGIPFLEARYPLWRSDAYHSRFNISDPACCLIAYLEGASRTFGPSSSRDYESALWRYLRPVPFHEVLKQHKISLMDAVGCGFARAPTDPNTFYAVLRNRWRMQFREHERLLL